MRRMAQRSFPLFQEDRMQMYSLLDRKLLEFGSIALAHNDMAVKRSLIDAVRGSKSLMEMHPEDFDLYAVGEFNVANGVVTPAPPQLIGNLREMLEAVNA